MIKQRRVIFHPRRYLVSKRCVQRSGGRPIVLRIIRSTSIIFELPFGLSPHQTVGDIGEVGLRIHNREGLGVDLVDGPACIVISPWCDGGTHPSDVERCVKVDVGCVLDRGVGGFVVVLDECRVLVCVAVENTCDRGGRKASHDRAEKCSWVVGGACSSAGNVANDPDSLVNFLGGSELADEKFECRSCRG